MIKLVITQNIKCFFNMFTSTLYLNYIKIITF